MARVQEVIHITCNMGTRDSPDMYALRLWAYISDESPAPMLQLLYIYSDVSYNICMRMCVRVRAC